MKKLISVILVICMMMSMLGSLSVAANAESNVSSDGFAVILRSDYDAEEGVAYVKLGFEDDTEGTYRVGKAYTANEADLMDPANSRQSDFANNSAFGYVVKYSIMPDGSVDLSAQDFKKADQPEGNLKTFSDDGVYDGTLCGYSPYNDDTIIFMLYGQPGYDIVPPGSLIIDATIDGFAPVRAKAFKLSELRDIGAQSIQYLCKADFCDGTIDYVEDGIGSYILDDVNASKPTVLAGAMTVGRDTRHVDTIDKNLSVAYVVNAVQEYNAQTNEYYANLTLINENGLFNARTTENVKDFFSSSVLPRDFVGTFEDIIGAPAYININDDGKVSRLHSYKEEQREETNKNTQNGWYIVNITKKDENTIYFYDTDEDVDLGYESPASLKIHEDGCKIIGISENQYIGETLTVLSQETEIISAEDGGNAIIEVREGQITRIFSFKENYVYDEIEAPIIEKPVLKADFKYTYVEEYNKSKGTIKLASEKGIYNIVDVTLKENIAVQTPVVYYIEDNKTVIEAVEIITGKVELFKGDGGVVIGGNTYYLWEENEEVYGDGYSNIFDYFNEDRELANNENVKYYVFGNILLGWTIGDEPVFEEKYKEPEVITGRFKFVPQTNISSEYKNDADQISVYEKFSYDDSYFDKDAKIYNHALAKVSIRLAMSAFGKQYVKNGKIQYDRQYENVEDFMSKMKFTNISHNMGYERQPTENSIGVAVGMKRIAYTDSGDCALLAVAIRGGNYESEWAGNFNVGNGNIHAGFNEAANQVVEYVKNYITENDICDSIKIWITGYSRAAATANISAQKIVNGGLGYSIPISPEDVYAYCFETPSGVLNPNNDQQYNNIFNIVNQHDVVPMVAPNKWGYGRYGVTKFLPSELLDSEYAKKRGNMYWRYGELMKEIDVAAQKSVESVTRKKDEKGNVLPVLKYAADYYKIDDFQMRELDWSLGEGLHIQNAAYNVPQGVFLERTIDKLAINLKNPGYYSAKMQPAVTYLIKNTMGSGNLDEFLHRLSLNALTTTPWLVSPGFTTTEIKSIVKKSFEDINISVSDSVLNSIVNLFVQLFADDSIFTVIDNIERIAQGHYPELCMTWLDAIDKDDFSDTRLRTIYSNCPVDVEVYDSENILVAAIYDNEPQKIENSTIVAYVDESEQKIVHLPSDEEYSIRVRATADGSVTYSVQETNLETGEVDIVNYNNMKLTKDEVLIGIAENLMVTEGEYAVTLNEVPVTPEIIDNAENYTVNVSVSGNGIVTGCGTFYKGEYAKVNATAFDGEEFLGWFDGEQLVSSELEYRFAIDGNTSLEAKFTSNTCEILFVDGNDFVGKTRIEKGATVKYPQPVEKTGYTFTGYYVDELCTIKAEEGRIFSEDTIIYLGYKQYAVTPSTGNGGGLAAGGDKTTDGADKLGNEDDKKEDADVSPDAPAVSAPEFADLGAHAWAADAIGALAEAGIIKGTSENTFSPAANITRADFAILLVRAFNLTSDNTANFADVSANDYFAAELAIARNTGIVGGIGGNKFAPRNAITRQDMMVIVHRALESKPSLPKGGGTAEWRWEDTNNGEISSYPDSTSVAPYARDAVSALIGAGLVNGKSGRIAPNEYTTRAEVAVLLQRILEYVK